MRPDEIAPNGAFTQFCGPDEFGNHWDELLSRRMLKGLGGGSPAPRKVMLHLMPPGKGDKHWDDAAIRLALNEWEDAGRRFPLAWLRVRQAENENGKETLTPREADHLSGKLAEQGMPPALVGDILRQGDETFLLMDTRQEEQVRAALARSGMTGEKQRDFTPAECMQETRISVGSPRLDAVVARAFHIGRAEAKKAVTRGFVALNLRIARDASREVIAGDLVYHLLAGAMRVDELSAGRTEGRHKLRARIPVGAKLMARG
ncbi:MAG: hypothetical protein A2Y63_00620 [Candidatus Riflebacteria bacterium RBG_13_59_9]|nr:MAG: hypothetical protein A2Y63_00620 [Candidatus Riflebacteria bacterium RBG_13_59_9]